MPNDNRDPGVGGEEALKPTHSLPRYSEPTPETHRKLTREEEAELALKRSSFTPGSQRLLIALFLFTISLAPLIQTAVELSSPARTGRLASELSKIFPSWTRIRSVQSTQDTWQLLPRGADLKAVEKSIESASVVSEWLLPHVQSVLTGIFHAGNEQVYPGGKNWLFYRPDVDYITGPPFLDPARMRHRAHVDRVQPDPIKTIVDFRGQLAERGIDLIVIPVPTKAGMDAAMLSSRADQSVPLQNPSFLEFKTRLESAGIRILDPGPALIQRKTALAGAPLYLETDTHWRPETMQFVSENLATWIPSSSTPNSTTLQIAHKEMTGLGDIFKMLRLPSSQRIYGPEKISLQQVSSGNGAWRASTDGDILLLGDSFSNIFSLEALGWGESSGFAEHLSRALGGRPLDCILRNSDGAFATREMLARDLSRGNDRLKNKKLVIWEFAARELAFGDWKLLDLNLHESPAAQFFVPKIGEQLVINGTIEAISAVPRPGTVPYRDHILALHLVDAHIDGRPEEQTLQSLVYLESMRDNVLTAAAQFRPGDRVRLRIRPWTEVSEEHEKTNRSEIDDPAIQLEEPCWGETVQ